MNNGEPHPLYRGERRSNHGSRYEGCQVDINRRSKDGSTTDTPTSGILLSNAPHSMPAIILDPMIDGRRTLYNEELRFNLDTSRTISYNALRIEVLKATNRRIEFRVISDDDQPWDFTFLRRLRERYPAAP